MFKLHFSFITVHISTVYLRTIPTKYVTVFSVELTVSRVEFKFKFSAINTKHETLFLRFTHNVQAKRIFFFLHRIGKDFT